MGSYRDSLFAWKHFSQHALHLAVKTTLVATFVFVRTVTCENSETGLPVIQPFIFPSTLTEGASAKVLCNVYNGKRPYRFQWTKNGEKLSGTGTKSGRVQVSTQEDFSMLVIDKIKSEDAGNYTCAATNSLGRVEHTAELVVRGSPVWLSTPSDIREKEGSTLALTCSASGLPRPAVTWYKISRDVSRGDVMPIPRSHGNGTLVIESASKSDAGLYECRAANGVGDGISKEILIDIYGITETLPDVYHYFVGIMIINMFFR